jgi:hypothetical protein
LRSKKNGRKKRETKDPRPDFLKLNNLPVQAS